MNYLLACKTCGNEIPVSTGQAGQTLQCRCGTPVEIPSIREMRELPVAEETSSGGPVWGLRQGLFFLGGAIAAATLAGIGVLWLMRPALVDVRAGISEAELSTLQAEVKATPLEESYMRYESVRPWPPQLFAEQKNTPTYLLASQELIKAFEAGGSQFLTPKSARPALEKIQERANQNMYALYKRKQLREWMIYLAVAGGIGFVVAAAGFLAQPEAVGQNRKRNPTPQASR
jgi:hypothetical protein